MFRRCVLRREAYGFIGLGQMGARMAPNFFKDSNCTALFLYDVNQTVAAELKKQLADKGQVEVCSSPAEVASKTTKIITMLPNGKIVDDVYNNPESGIFSTVKKGTMVVDSSTVDPKTPRDLVMTAGAKGATFFDAPVSGGVMGAAAGTLTFMVGSPSEDAFTQVAAFLKPLAKSVVNCGGTGNGQVVKLCNNMILAQHMIAVSEAMLMGTRLGVAPQTLAGIFNTSTGRCWSGDTCNPFPGVMPNVPSSNGYKGGFGNSLMLKDLGLAMQAAELANLEVRGGKNAFEMYRKVCDPTEAGGNKGELDFSSILQYIDETSPKK